MKVFSLKKVSVVFSLVVLLILTNHVSAQRYWGRSGYYHPSPRVYAYAPTPIFRPSVQISLGLGSPYYARPYVPYYRPYIPYGPSIGFRVSVLPYGYWPFYFGSDYYYYYDNTFYRRYDDRNYEVVAPPIGAKLPQLPKNAKAVTIDGIRYYELGGTYYQETRNEKNQVLYEVVGVNGELKTNQLQNNSNSGNNINNGNFNNQNQPQQNRPIQEGDFVDNLPGQCRTITVNGQTLYVSPDNIYYQQINESNRTYYKVVGK
ncbi:DUF6515 family protein [Parasediminibacterium paludis]|uniref:DUF6515 family protein n=1 Tax=Parasediminibacterium paludis TaxID=908966 RepID=A0ABV8Q0G9_9BACT